MLLQKQSKQYIHLCVIGLHILFTFATSPLAQEFDSPEEAEAYAAYLQGLEGLTLNLNKAPQSDFLDLPGLTPNLAWRIVTFRPYQKLQDLHRVPGITPNLFEQITPYLTLNTKRRWQGHLTTRVTRPTNHPNQMDHMRLTQRMEIQMDDNITGYLLTDRDPEEPAWADYWTAHLKIRHKRGQFIVGDIRPEIGQGLLHSRQTRSAASLSNIRPRSHNHIANRNSTEFGAIRGIHLTTQYGPIHVQALYGQAAWDADIVPNGDVQIRRTEQHSSETTLKRKNALTEYLTTVHMSVGSSQNHIGGTIQTTRFSPQKPQEITSRHISINGRGQFYHTTLFGEMALGGKTQAFVTGMNWQKETFRLHLLIRKYSPRFSALHGAPIAAYGTPPQNEQGLFFGFTYRPSSRTRIELSLDRHKHLIPERHPLPDQGHRFRLVYQLRMGKKTLLKLTHSTKNTRYTSNRTENRATFNWAHRALRTTSWIARTKLKQSQSGLASGLRLQIGQTYRLTLWTTVYNISDYAARIYDFEPDVWGSGTLQTRIGKGQSAGVLIAWSTTPFRIATRYSFRKTDGTPTSSWAIQFTLRR